MKLFFILTLFPVVVFGQNARFYVDTLHSRNLSGEYKKINEYLKVMEWKINGQAVNYKSKPAFIMADSNKLDTILFKERKNSRWDTMICNVKTPSEYKFLYNHCCGGFDIADYKGHNIHGQVQFKLKEKASNKIYLGTIGEAGIIVDHLTIDTLKPFCRSAMSPNTYRITFSEIRICKDSTNCPQVICLDRKEKEIEYDVNYKTISNKLSINYLPLSTEPLQIVYDPKTAKVTVR